MTYFLYILALALVSVIQLSLIDLLSIRGIVPNLPAILLVFIAFREGRRFGMLSGFVLGLMLDLITGRLPGTGPLVLSITGFLAGFAGRKPFLHFYSYFSVFSLLLLWFYLSMHFVVYVGHFRFWALLITETVPSFFYSVAFLLFFLLCVPDHWWKGRKLTVDI